MAPTPPATIGQRLRKLREERGLTRPQVHDLILTQFGEDLPTSTLENWELEKSEPRASGAAQLARIYDVSLDYVFLLSDEPKEKR